MELCSVLALPKDDGCGVVKFAFLRLFKPTNPVATKEVDIDSVGTNGDDGSVRNIPIHWDLFCNDFADAFEPPGFPVKHNIKHDVELLPGITS